MSNAASRGIIGRVALEMTALPEEDLPLVLDFVDALKKRRTAPAPYKTAQELVAEAKRRADLLADVPRAERVARFERLVEEIRQEAIEKGTAIDGDLDDE